MTPAVRTLRWLLVAPAALLVWYLAGALGLALQSALPCAAGQMLVEGCEQGSGGFLHVFARYLQLSLTVVAMVLLPAWLAPALRGVVAWSMLGLAAAIAGHRAWMDGAWGEAALAVALGLFATAFLRARELRQRWARERAGHSAQGPQGH